MLLGSIPLSPSAPQMVPIIGYHEFGGPPEFAGGPRYDLHGLNIPVESFRSQLALMYQGGYWPINAGDLVRNKGEVPTDKKPIVLTFDDGRPTQFRYLLNGKVDPSCAVGVLLEFHRTHPDWPLRGTFYLIAGSDSNGVPFDQEGMEGKKIRQLVKWGFEIGNHTLTHPSFAKLSKKQVEKEIAGAYRYLTRIDPGIQVDTLALPYGILPTNPNSVAALRSGSYHGVRYRNTEVLLFDGHFCPAPGSPSFNPFAMSRLAPTPEQMQFLTPSAASP